jgi:hypothetical protein
MPATIRDALKSSSFRYLFLYMLLYLSLYIGSASHFVAITMTIFFSVPFIVAFLLMQLSQHKFVRYCIFTFVFTAIINLFLVWQASSVNLTAKSGQSYGYIDGKITLFGLAYNSFIAISLCVGLIVANRIFLAITRRL